MNTPHPVRLTSRTVAAALTVALSLVVGARSQATTVYDTFPYWDGNTTYGWYQTAQTITAPTDNMLSKYSFGIAQRTSPGNLKFGVYEWGSGGGPTGSELYSKTVGWSSGGVIDIEDINLNLTTGKQYGMVVDLLGYSGSSVHFESKATNAHGGNGYWSFDGTSWSNFSYLDHEFRAEFNSAPEPGSLALLGCGVALAALRRRRRRK